MIANEKNEVIYTAATMYFKIGFNIVPVKGKQPLVKWQKWIVNRQSQKEFDSLNFFGADSIGVICGTKNLQGLYLAVIDFDVKNLPIEAIEKGKKILKQLPITQTEETPSGGQHLIYYVHNQPKTISFFHNEQAIELLGKGKLCIMAPSRGYQRQNDNTPTIISDLEDTLYKALYNAGIKIKKKNKTWFNKKPKKEGYKGKDPLCILEIEKGTKEGLRNEHGIRLASYYINFKQHSPDQTLKILRKWNRLNTPSLKQSELIVLLKSAILGKYVYGCRDSVLKALCDIESCAFAPQTAKIMTAQEKEMADALCYDPKLLNYVLAYGRKKLIGEDNIILQNLIAIVSGQTHYPISEIITGHSGSGKNQSIRAVKSLIPEDWLFEITTSTPEAIKYLPENFAGTLIIYELAGIRSDTGTLGLRAVGEGESIETIYPMRDKKTGKMTLGRSKTNAKNFITTESGIGIHPDLYRRVLKKSMTDSDLLTKRVCAKKLRDASYPESLKKKLRIEKHPIPYSETDFQNALSSLDLDLEVVIFPPSSLLKLVDYAVKKEQKVALRSQIDRILNFVKVLAILHQKQRIRFKDEKNSYVIADVKDVEKTFQILKTTIMETISRIEKRQRQALEIMEQIGDMDKNMLAEKIGVSTVTSAKILKSLSKVGYLKEIQTTKPYTYQLTDVENNRKSFILSENITEYKAFYETELKNFQKHILSPHHKPALNFKIEGLEPIIEQLENSTDSLTHIQESQNNKHQSEQDSSSFKENNGNSIVFSEKKNENGVKT